MMQKTGSVNQRQGKELSQSKQEKEKRVKKNKDSLRDLWDNIKRNNICIIGVPEGEERERERQRQRENEAENIFEEIKAEKFPILGEETDIQVQEA